MNWILIDTNTNFNICTRMFSLAPSRSTPVWFFMLRRTIHCVTLFSLWLRQYFSPFIFLMTNNLDWLPELFAQSLHNIPSSYFYPSEVQGNRFWFECKCWLPIPSCMAMRSQIILRMHWTASSRKTISLVASFTFYYRAELPPSGECCLKVTRAFTYLLFHSKLM